VSEIRRTTICDVNAPIAYRPIEYVRQLEALFDAFVDFVGRATPTTHEAFLSNLETRFRKLADDECEGSPLCALFPSADSLQRARLDYVSKLLGLEGADPETEQSISRFDATKARLHPSYHQMGSLCELLGRERAMPLLRSFMDEWMGNRTKADESLEDPSRFWDDLAGDHHETEEVAIRLSRGVIAFRVNRCLWADAMSSLDDFELAHVGTCYGDFPQIPAINSNFVLTRTMTLMQGAPYCDTCIHDRRHVSSIEHPSRAVFDALGASS